MNKKFYAGLICWLTALGLTQGQPVTLEECYQLAQSNYPLIKEYALIKKAEAYSLENASKGYLPQLQIAGQGTYQSEVTQLPFSLPSVDMLKMNKDQYKLYGEISQPITDLFAIKHQKELIEVSSRIEEQKIEVELYALKERINQLYFGILLMEQQIIQGGILKKDFQNAIDKNNVAIKNGIALKSSGNVLKAELLNAEQRIIELRSVRKGYIDMLALFIGRDINENSLFEKPLVDEQFSEVNRPEIKLFEMQKQIYDVQGKLVDTNLRPRFSLFLQGGYGRPALNMLNNDFDFYYVGGIRLIWNIAGFYTHKKDKLLLSENQNRLDIQKDMFLFNTNLSLKQQNSEIAKLGELIAADKKVVELREGIKLSAKSQLEEGTITVNDFLLYVNAGDRAMQNLILHEMELLMTQYKIRTTLGN